MIATKAFVCRYFVTHYSSCSLALVTYISNLNAKFEILTITIEKQDE